MAYSTASDVMDMIKDDMIDSLLDGDRIDDLTERREALSPHVELAINDADSEINGYLNKRYDVPFKQTPSVLNKFSKDIALYNLISRIGIGENERDKNYLTRYHAAIKFLEQVAKGIIEIGVTSNSKSSAVGFSMKSQKRNFSRSTMKGW